MDTSHDSLHKAKLATLSGELFVILCAASGLHALASVVFWALVVVASVKINANMRLVSRDGDCIDLVAYLVMMLLVNNEIRVETGRSQEQGQK